MSASRPSMTERACLPDPPCDWRMVSSTPELAWYALTKAASTARYNSRVGSYDTFNNDCASCACAGKPSTKVAATAARAVQNVFFGMLASGEEYQRWMQVCRPEELNGTNDFLIAHRH